eukprot:403345004
MQFKDVIHEQSISIKDLSFQGSNTHRPQIQQQSKPNLSRQNSRFASRKSSVSHISHQKQKSYVPIQTSSSSRQPLNSYDTRCSQYMTRSNSAINISRHGQSANQNKDASLNRTINQKQNQALTDRQTIINTQRSVSIEKTAFSRKMSQNKLRTESYANLDTFIVQTSEQIDNKLQLKQLLFSEHQHLNLLLDESKKEKIVEQKRKRDLDLQVQAMSDKNGKVEAELKRLKEEAQRLKSQISNFSIKYMGQYQALIVERDMQIKRVEQNQQDLQKEEDRNHDTLKCQNSMIEKLQGKNEDIYEELNQFREVQQRDVRNENAKLRKLQSKTIHLVEAIKDDTIKSQRPKLAKLMKKK